MVRLVGVDICKHLIHHSHSHKKIIVHMICHKSTHLSIRLYPRTPLPQFNLMVEFDAIFNSPPVAMCLTTLTTPSAAPSHAPTITTH